MEKIGPQIVAYHPRYWHRLQWQQVEVPAPYREHWLAYHNGQLAGEFFRGKSGMFYGLVYTHRSRRIHSFWRRERVWVLYTIAALILGPEH